MPPAVPRRPGAAGTGGNGFDDPNAEVEAAAPFNDLEGGFAKADEPLCAADTVGFARIESALRGVTLPASGANCAGKLAERASARGCRFASPGPAGVVAPFNDALRESGDELVFMA